MSPDPDVANAFARVWSVNAARLTLDENEEEQLAPFTRYMREMGRGVTGSELHTALLTFRGIGQLLADLVFGNYDVLLTPTMAKPPARIGEFSSDPDQAADYMRMMAFMPYTPLSNIAGLPALSLPIHWNEQNLPIGVMISGRYGDERAILELAKEIEPSVRWPEPRVGGGAE